MFHTDKKLNKLYEAISKIDVTKDEDLDKVWPLMDKIADRRIELGEISEDELA